MSSRIALTVGALLVATCAVAYHKFFWHKKFDVVESCVLYRSGVLHSWQLRRLIRDAGIKSIFSFTHTNNDQEQRLCDELGVPRFFHYLPGDGVGPDEPYLRFLSLVQDPANHPMLVHCSAGVQRTGGAVLLYRCLFQGWDFDDAVAEMIAMGNRGEQAQIEQLRKLHINLRGPGHIRHGFRSPTWR